MPGDPLPDETWRLELVQALVRTLHRWSPPPRLTVSEWADRYRRLSSEASAEPGRWYTSRAEYQRGIMDSANDPSVHTVVVMSSAQVGKTEFLGNVLGYHIHHDPGPILFLQPTLEMAQAYSKDRLAPMVRDCPELRALVGDSRAKDGENTILHKKFPGGHVTLAGANSPASLASRPIRIVLADEVDRYPPSAGTEGDPLNLAFKRTTTFWNRKRVVTSTPIVKGVSRIEAAYLGSDQRRFFVPCPHCGHKQTLKWSGVTWNKSDLGEHMPETAGYACDGCGAVWTDGERWAAVSKGYWQATAEFKGIAGFHLNEIYSPWVTLEQMVRGFLEAKKGGAELMKTWVNTALGETWEESGETINDGELMDRRESYTIAPRGVVVVTAGVDVQQTRLEVERVGWGLDDESWGLGKTVIYGDPTGPEPWLQLDELLQQRIDHASGLTLPVMATAVDSQFLTQRVTLYTRERWHRRIWAIRGVAGPGRPLWPKRAMRRKATSDQYFNIGVDSGKETLYARLRILNSGPGYCHFNMGYDLEHFDQLTAEEVKTKYSRGLPVRYWELRAKKKRNEALDIRVYAMAAFEGLKAMGVNVKRRMVEMEKKAQQLRSEGLLSAPDDEALQPIPDDAAEPAPPSQTPPPPPEKPLPAVKKKKRPRRVVGRFSVGRPPGW